MKHQQKMIDSVTVIRRPKPADTPAAGAKLPTLGPEGFPVRLRQLRERAELTQREQELLAGLSPGHSQMIESGKRPHCAARTVAVLSRVYGVSMDWLFLGLGEPVSQSALDTHVARAFAKLEKYEEQVDKMRDEMRVPW